MGCQRQAHSPVQTAEDGGHAHHHVGDRQSVGCVLPSKLLELLSGRLISQEQLVGALEETWDHRRSPVSPVSPVRASRLARGVPTLFPFLLLALVGFSPSCISGKCLYSSRRHKTT